MLDLKQWGTRKRQEKLPDIWHSDRCIIDDPVLVETTWQRILKACMDVECMAVDPDTDSVIGKMFFYHVYDWNAVGLNEGLRCLRYKSGDYFKPHQDGAYVRGNEASPDHRKERSIVTCQRRVVWVVQRVS